MKHLLFFKEKSDVDTEKFYDGPGIIYVKDIGKKGYANYRRGTFYKINFDENDKIVPVEIKFWKDSTIWKSQDQWGK